MTLPNVLERRGNPLAQLLLALFLFSLPLLTAAHARAQSYSVTVERPMRTIPIKPFAATGKTPSPGEAQSTVVPPGANKQCPAGRFLTTNDAAVGLDDDKVLGPANPGSVILIDLDGSNIHNATVVTDAATAKKLSPYKFLTKDHDIVAMPNGDVVLIWSMHFATPFAAPASKPDWFDVTFHDPRKDSKFGPGTRRGVMSWVSNDCGENFRYVGLLDPANYDDNTCASPIQDRDKDGKFIKEPPYRSGGPDGQLVRVDPAAPGRLYMMFPCGGQQRDASKKDSFVLSDEPLAKTLVLSSDDEGKSWTKLGTLPVAGWRYGVVPLSQDDLAFATTNTVSFGRRTPGGAYNLDSSLRLIPGAWGWPGLDVAGVKTVASFNVAGHTIVTRVPGDKDSILLVVPAVVRSRDGKDYNGYRVLFYDRVKNQYAEVASVFPSKPGAESFAMHLTAIDLGEGPVLLYWYDMDVAAKKGTVKGRLITGKGLSSGDFYIFTGKPPVKVSVAGGGIVGSGGGPALKPAGPVYEPTNFDLPAAQHWYGDYNTAGGYVQPLQPSDKQGTQKTFAPGKYHFYPMWVGPLAEIQFAHVEADEQQPPPLDSTLKVPQPLTWRPMPPPVEPSKRKPSPAEVRDILGYGNHSGEQNER